MIKRLWFNKKKKLQEGFTLVELLVVVTIIVILSAIGVVNYRSMLEKSRDSRRKSDLEQIRAALELYRADEGIYPAAFAGCGESYSIASATNVYMNGIPCDPDGTSAYCYVRGAGNLTYTLGAVMEVDDPSGNCTVCIGGEDYCLQNP